MERREERNQETVISYPKDEIVGSTKAGDMYLAWVIHDKLKVWTGNCAVIIGRVERDSSGCPCIKLGVRG